ncbi:MAG: aryl-sulfate sulfotransferase [Candidatus Acidiferrales bacterium]
MRKTVIAAFACMAFLVFVSGCGSSGTQSTNPPPPPPPPTVTVSVTPIGAAVTPGNSTQFTATISGDTAVTWSVNGTPGGDSTDGTIDSTGDYTAPAAAQSVSATVTAASVKEPSVSSSATAYVIVPGQVTTTNHPLVALYSIDPPASANVMIQFGPDTNYGQSTSTQQSPAGGGSVGILVAGMTASSTYHMRASVKFADGTLFTDADQTFDTGTLSPLTFAAFTGTTTAGMTPQPGIEMLDMVVGAGVPVVATDLAGNIIWWYNFTDGTASDIVQPIRLLPNGHFLVCIGPASSNPVNGTPPLPGTITVVREIDLAGNTIREISVTDLNTRLANAGFNLLADTIHHDVLQLANGHWIILTSSTRDFMNLTGLPGTTTVLGDQIIDLDTNLNPVWVWNSFDHLDVNRHPYLFPDWTHSNALLYTGDGNLLLSMRHQNWVIKIDYANGNGAGDILWHLGEQGDFTLLGGTDPQDWFYAQHNPAFFSRATFGKFELGLMDNGDDRMYPNGQTCASTGGPLCPNYTTIPIYQIDENTHTATIVFDDKLAQYSFFGGGVDPLANGDVEFDLCALPGAPNAKIFEVTREANPQVVWQMTVTGKYAYRGFRLPSLYPQAQF